MHRAPSLLVAFAVGALAGCVTTTPQTPSTAVQDSEQRPVPLMGDLDGGLGINDQSLKPDDVQLRQTIREALLADPFLSSTAKSVNIVSNDKRVTLRGVVTNEQERQLVARYANDIAGAESVDNLLQVPTE